MTTYHSESNKVHIDPDSTVFISQFKLPAACSKQAKLNTEVSLNHKQHSAGYTTSKEPTIHSFRIPATFTVSAMSPAPVEVERSTIKETYPSTAICDSMGLMPSRYVTSDSWFVDFPSRYGAYKWHLGYKLTLGWFMLKWQCLQIGCSVG